MMWLYYASQAVLIATLAVEYSKNRLGDMDKGSVLLLTLMVVFGPLGLLALFIASWIEMRQASTRKRCGAIEHNWEKLARAGKAGLRDWYMASEWQEQRLELLRETVYSLTDKELDLMLSVSKSTYNIDKPMRDTLIDEMICRKLLNDGNPAVRK